MLTDRIARVLDLTGLQILEPFVRLVAGDEPRKQIRSIALFVGVPILAFALFLAAWAGVAKTIVTKYGTLPTPVQVLDEANNLLAAHHASRAAQAEFYDNQEKKAATYRAAATKLQAAMAAMPTQAQQAVKQKLVLLEQRAQMALSKKYSASPSYVDQILTSLKTVFFGFVIASLIAIPLGILCGLSPVFQAAINPLVQIFKPVSPLAWLPIVMIVVGALGD